MMEPDPAEIGRARRGLQSVQRIKRIYEISTLQPPKSPPPMPHPTEMTGSFCPKCHSIHLRHKEGGCMACLDCGFDLGCGG